MNDRMKVIYGDIMFAARPLFVKLDYDEQAEVINRVVNMLTMRHQLGAASARDNIEVKEEVEAEVLPDAE